MKSLLVTVNIILSILLLAGAVRFFRNTAPVKNVYSVPKRSRTVSAQAVPAQKKQQTAPLSKEAQMLSEYDTVIKENIFNQERCPNIGAARNVRVTMTLVGTCTIGSMQGAVILQKQSGNNNLWMPPPMMTGGGRRQGFTQGGNNQNRNRQNGNPGMGGPGMGGPGMGGPPPPFMQRNQNQTTEIKQNFKQFIRVGETLANGYKLISITRTTATLTRGGDKLELELQEASVNAPKGNSPNNNNNRQNGRNMMQQFLNTMQNMQRMQGFQNMQNMRMMQQMMNGNGGGMPSGNMNSRGGRSRR